jgi:hypothetical protein
MKMSFSASRFAIVVGATTVSVLESMATDDSDGVDPKVVRGSEGLSDRLVDSGNGGWFDGAGDVVGSLDAGILDSAGALGQRKPPGGEVAAVGAALDSSPDEVVDDVSTVSSALEGLAVGGMAGPE